MKPHHSGQRPGHRSGQRPGQRPDHRSGQHRSGQHRSDHRPGHRPAAREILHLAARLLAEGGVVGGTAALRKAAVTLDLPTRDLPPLKDLEQALAEYQRLFVPGHEAWIAGRRCQALAAMRFLAPFRPLLVGGVLSGTACAHDPVTLHCFAAPAEDLAHFLMDHGIPYTLAEHRLRWGRATLRALPCFQIEAEGVPFRLVVIPQHLEHHPPLCPVEGRAMQRVAAAGLNARLAALARPVSSPPAPG